MENNLWNETSMGLSLSARILFPCDPLSPSQSQSPISRVYDLSSPETHNAWEQGNAQVYLSLGEYFNAFGGLSLNPRNPLVEGITLAKDSPTRRR